jgi:hypothetical protein
MGGVIKFFSKRVVESLPENFVFGTNSVFGTETKKFNFYQFLLFIPFKFGMKNVKMIFLVKFFLTWVTAWIIRKKTKNKK